MVLCQPNCPWVYPECCRMCMGRPPSPSTHCIGRAEMSFQSLLLFCLCFTAFVSQLFLTHDFCCKNVSARPPLCLISFTAGQSLSRASLVSLPSAFLQPLKPSQGLFSNMPGASTQQLRATFVSSAKSLLLFLTQ